jgi:AcrR family transcriptional regulator
MTTVGRSELVWVRQPLQARSQATLTRLLDATESLLERDPFDALSVQAICKEARSSVGAFYTRFPDKTSLLHLLHERWCEEARATATAALHPDRWIGMPLPEVVVAVVGFVVADYRTRRGLRKEMVRRNGLDEAFRKRSVDVAAFTAQRLGELLAARQQEMSHPDPRFAAEVCHRILFSVLDQHAIYGDGGPVGMSLTDDALGDQLALALIAYLGPT